MKILLSALDLLNNTDMHKVFISLRAKLYLKQKYIRAIVKHILSIRYDLKEIHDLIEDTKQKYRVAELRADFRKKHYYKGKLEGLEEVIKYTDGKS